MIPRSFPSCIPTALEPIGARCGTDATASLAAADFNNDGNLDLAWSVEGFAYEYGFDW